MRNTKDQFQLGHSGGRPKGARNKLAAQVFEGASAMAAIAQTTSTLRRYSFQSRLSAQFRTWICIAL